MAANNNGTSLFWDKKERTRKKSAIVYGGLTVLFFILFGISCRLWLIC